MLTFIDVQVKKNIVFLQKKHHYIWMGLNDDNDGGGMGYFLPSEFLCKCGQCGLGFKHMDLGLLKRLDTARRVAGIPFVITSSIRCHDHNQAVGGSEISAHLTGQAIDIAVRDSSKRYDILKALLYAGFDRVGIGPEMIHADIDDKKMSRVIWTY